MFSHIVFGERIMQYWCQIVFLSLFYQVKISSSELRSVYPPVNQSVLATLLEIFVVKLRKCLDPILLYLLSYLIRLTIYPTIVSSEPARNIAAVRKRISGHMSPSISHHLHFAEQRRRGHHGQNTNICPSWQKYLLGMRFVFLLYSLRWPAG